MGTFGVWTFPDDVMQGKGMILATVEPPWKGNQRRISCIPEGKYTVFRDQRPKRGDCFCVVSHALGVSRLPEVDMARDSILVHIANYASELEGCIAPGTDISAAAGVWMVTNSRKAINQINAWVGSETEFNLTITQYQPEGM
jgi:hypothetical protein